MYLINGVKQGYNLSPVYFNIFCLDIVEEIEKLNLGIETGGRVITLLVFADDITIILRHIEDLT